MNTYERIGEWVQLQRELVAVKEKELALRNIIFAELFPDPKEGTNTFDLPEGWKVKGTYKMTRTLDEAALPAVLETLRKKKVNVEDLIKYKPSLDTASYRKLADAHRSILEQAMTIKPATPSLEVTTPKSAS